MSDELDTPETDSACDYIYNQGVAHIPLVGFMEKLERERNEALKLHAYANEQRKALSNELMNTQENLERIIDSVRNLKNVQGRYNTQLAMNQLMKLLPENQKQ